MKTPILFYPLIISLTLASCKNETDSNTSVTEPSQVHSITGQIIDLSHTFSEETIYWVTAKEFNMEVVSNGFTDKGFFYAANNFETAEHGGTHIDAPIHFSEGKQTVEEIPLEKLIGQGIKIDVSEIAENTPDYLISVEDLKNWELEHKQEIPENSIVILETGYSKWYPDKLKYLGTNERGPEAVKLLHFPGLAPAAAKWLVKNRSINAIGIDTPSIDYGQSSEFGSHVTLLSENIPAFENLTNLDKLPEIGFNVIALPMKIKNGSGAPLRIIGIVN